MRKLFLFILSAINLASGQSTIVIDSTGKSHNNIDGVIMDVYDQIDISDCNKVELLCDFSFSQPWEGNANLEYSDECEPYGGCLGDPDFPELDGCAYCWDFMRIKLFIDNVQVFEDLIGETGTTDSEQNGVFDSDILCSSTNSTARIEISNQNWAGAEVNSFSNLILLCYSDVESNVYNDQGSGLWTDPANWSLGIIPTSCNHVIIPPFNTATIQSNESGICFTIDVSSNAELIIQDGGLINVITSNY